MQIAFFMLIAVLLFVIYIISSGEEKKSASKSEHKGKLQEYWEKERRKSPRFNATLEVKYQLLKNPKPTPPAKSKNISEGGICISAYEMLPTNSLIHLDIVIPTSNQPITIKGRVAWREEVSTIDEDGRRTFLTGIEFFDLDKHQKENLLNYINTHLAPKAA